MFYQLDEPTLTNMIDFFQKCQQDSLKELALICDGKEGKKIQQQVAIYNTLVMNLIKLRTIKKASSA